MQIPHNFIKERLVELPQSHLSRKENSTKGEENTTAPVNHEARVQRLSVSAKTDSHKSSQARVTMTTGQIYFPRK
jgi:hypothetical protein